MTQTTDSATPETEQPNRFWVFLGFQVIAFSALWNPKKAHQIWRDHCAEEPKRKQREIDAKMHSLSRSAPDIRKGVTGTSAWGPAHELIASAELARLREINSDMKETLRRIRNSGGAPVIVLDTEGHSFCIHQANAVLGRAAKSEETTQ